MVKLKQLRGRPKQIKRAVVCIGKSNPTEPNPTSSQEVGIRETQQAVQGTSSGEFLVLLSFCVLKFLLQFWNMML
ncbi:hypothetical protein ACFX15_012967 [Malus domestica]